MAFTIKADLKGGRGGAKGQDLYVCSAWILKKKSFSKYFFTII